ncbi:hypothetical protein ABIC83_003066 [Roseateles asaccharophilus]|uniref:phage protein NinX family protein n=1 Tax=Roseateles asaccharophilus TaxID=582607 RepID=UPI003836C97A
MSTVKIKTTQLRDLSLDWVVARIEGLHPVLDGGFLCLHARTPNVQLVAYSNTDKADAIIDRERIATEPGGEGWQATKGLFSGSGSDPKYNGPTRRIAALICFVASRLGDEVEVPADIAAAIEAHETQRIRRARP